MRKFRLLPKISATKLDGVSCACVKASVSTVGQQNQVLGSQFGAQKCCSPSTRSIVKTD